MKVANLAKMANLAEVTDLMKFRHTLRFDRMTLRDGYNQSGEFCEKGRIWRK